MQKHYVYSSFERFWHWGQAALILFLALTGFELFSRRHVKKVLVADDLAQEQAAYLLLQHLGYENLAVLEGGLGEFQKKILATGAFVPTGSRWDADVVQFRDKARADILAMIASSRNVVKKETVKKKIKGGC